MAQYTTASRRIVTVGTLLGKGGEGEVLLVSGVGDQVAKIYHTTHRTPQREHKLQAMLANPPQDDTRRLATPHVSIAWPLDVLYERQQFAGFLMPRIDQSPTIFTIFNPVLRDRRYPSFDWRYLHRTAANLATAMNAFHARGYVVGDVNQKNVLVTPSAMVTWVDTDSFQVPDATGGNRGQVYRCPVGVPDYTPPELQGINLGTVDRRPEHDCFGLAVMVFQLLMQGYHPFTGVSRAGSAAPTGEIFRHNIEQGIFPHQANPHCAPPPAAPALAVLHPGLQQLFMRAFVDGHRNPPSRPTAREWLDGISQAEQMLVQCRRDPAHWYSSHHGQCQWCVQSSRTAVTPPVQRPLAPAKASRSPAPRSPVVAPPVVVPPRMPARGGRGSRWPYWSLAFVGLVVAVLVIFQVTRSTVPPVPVVPEAVVPEAAVPEAALDADAEILIPAGEFAMGCAPNDNMCEDDERPQHTVYLDAYYIDKYEVTNARYQACVDAGACEPPQEASSRTPDEYFGNPEFADYPVINVTWFQAGTFCAWEGKRLPTEAEWEKAARGTETRIWPWGDEFDGERLSFCDSNCEFDWRDAAYDDGYANTAPVGSYPTGASPYGVMDMAGNVWEWVNDWYTEDYYSASPASNPPGPATGGYRVLRGGSWIINGSGVRAANRGHYYPGLWGNDGVGFRCVRSQ